MGRPNYAQRLFVFHQIQSDVGRVGAKRRIEILKWADFDTPRQVGATQSTSINPNLLRMQKPCYLARVYLLRRKPCIRMWGPFDGLRANG